MKKSFFILFVLLLPLANQAQVPQFVKAGAKASVSTMGKKGVSTAFKGRIPTNVSTGVSSVGKPSEASTISTSNLVSPSSTNANLLSMKQIKTLALEMRPHYYKAAWENLPKEPLAATKDTECLIAGSGANLTMFSDEQWEKAKGDYLAAVASVQKLANYMGPQVYYLGSSEAERLHPEQIRQALADIGEASSLVKNAQATFGENTALEEMDAYLNYANRFYNTLGTGMYEPLEEMEAAPFSRTDNHDFDYLEFGLWGDSIKPLPKEPDSSWETIKSWIMGITKRGTLPKKMKVALLQDEEFVVNALKEMKRRGKLDGWEIDFPNPNAEEFLKGNYNSYDLILSDIVMPGGGGRYLARQLRAKGYQGSLIVVARFDSHAEDFYNDGFDGMMFIGDMAHRLTTDKANWLWTRLQNYYLYKQEHGWIH